MDKALADLIKISNATGKDPALVQSGGGNTSVKTTDGKYMYIKASGTALKDMNKNEGWRRLRLDSALAIIKDKSMAQLNIWRREAEAVNRLLLACDDEVTTDARPSVESHLHAFLDKCVIHLHPIVVRAFVNAKNGKAELEKLFKNFEFFLPPLWVPYANPGFTLAKKIAKLVGDYQNRFARKPAVLFLEKHGLIVTAETAESALKLVRKVTKLCSSKLKRHKNQDSRLKTQAFVQNNIIAAKLAIRKAVFNATGQYLPVSYFAANETIAAFMSRKDARKLLATPPLSPSELVYANGSAMWLEDCDVKTITQKLTSLVDKGRKPSAAFLIKGLGLFVTADKKISSLVAEITEGSLLVRMHAAGFGGVVGLNKRQQEFINNWEVKAFRKKPASNTK